MRKGWHFILASVGVLVGSLTGCGGGTGASIEYYLSVRAAVPLGPSQAELRRADPPPADAHLLWLSMLAGQVLAADGEEAQTKPSQQVHPEPPAKARRVHWSKRRGPAYPDDFWRSVGRDAKEMPATLWDDTKATFTNPWALVGLGAAGVAGALINCTGLDDTVADCFDYDGGHKGSHLNTEWDSVGGFFGSPAVHFPVAGLMYLTALGRKDMKGYETSKTLINALAITGLTTLSLKAVFQTRSPNGDPWGWPSGHTSSSFCLATVLAEAYGPWVGVPLLTFASFVAYERVDANNHDLSDVVSGAIIGIVIGHAVMQNHKPKIFGFQVAPWADPRENAFGLALVREF